MISPMKKISVILTVLILAVATFAAPIPLTTALKNGQVQATLRSEGGFARKCIRLTVRNKTKKTLELRLAAGQYLVPRDTAMQRMLLSETLLLTLTANATADYVMYAFCAQQHHSCPLTNAVFSIGARAPKPIAELAELIEQRKLYDKLVAQEAVWCLTDNAKIYHILSENAADELALRQYVAAVKGIDLTKIPAVKRTREVYQEVGVQRKQYLPDRDTVNYNTTNTQYIIKNMKVRAADKTGDTETDPTGDKTQEIKAAQGTRNTQDNADYEAQKALQGAKVKEIKGVMSVNIVAPCFVAIQIISPTGALLQQVYQSQDVVQGKAKLPYSYQEFNLSSGIYQVQLIDVATKRVLQTDTVFGD